MINTLDHNISPSGLSILSGCLNPSATSALKDPIPPRACLKGSGPTQAQCSHRHLHACWPWTEVLQPVLQARVKQKLQKLFSNALPSISSSWISLCPVPHLSTVEPQLQRALLHWKDLCDSRATLIWLPFLVVQKYPCEWIQLVIPKPETFVAIPHCIVKFRQLLCHLSNEGCTSPRSLFFSSSRCVGCLLCKDNKTSCFYKYK